MNDRCVACASRAWVAVGTWEGYTLATCRECGVTFTRNPDYKPARYVALYERNDASAPVPETQAQVYAPPGRRLVWETRAFSRLLPPPRLTPAEVCALGWLRAHADGERPVVDCGCGTGRFLDALSRAGIDATGVELSPALVAMLNRRGLRAVVGAAPDFPWDGPAPLAVTFFEVLEHLADPECLIAGVKRRFPEAHILASVPSPLRPAYRLNGRRGLADYPPNHFTRWTAAGLERFFLRLGYRRVLVMCPPPAGSEMLPGAAQLFFSRRLLRAPIRLLGPGPSGKRFRLAAGAAATAALWLLRGYQAATDIAGHPLATRAARDGASAGSLLAVATLAPASGTAR